MPGTEHVTLLGDFTLHHRVESQKKWCAWRETSVVEHLKALLPEDRFQVNSFGEGAEKAADVLHDSFIESSDAHASITSSDVVVVSVGAADFQALLHHAFVVETDENARKEFLGREYPTYVNCMQLKQNELINKIHQASPDAYIVFVTQPYLALAQQAYDMQTLGRVLGIGKPWHHPADVMHTLMKDMYQPIFETHQGKPMMVVDVASSLNPYDGHDYSAPLEPSNSGSKKIAQMLKYMLVDGGVEYGQAYRFFPSFFYGKNEAQYVGVSELQAWEPARPYDLREGYSRAEEAVFEKANTANTSVDDLLVQLATAINAHAPQAIKPKAQAVYNEAALKQKLLNPGEEKQLKMSIILATHVLEEPTYDNIALLERHAYCCAMGKGDSWKALMGTLIAVVGGFLAMSGLGIAAVAAGGVLAVGGGATMFAYRRTSLAKADLNLAEHARISLVDENARTSRADGAKRRQDNKTLRTEDQLEMQRYGMDVPKRKRGMSV